MDFNAAAEDFVRDLSNHHAMQSCKRDATYVFHYTSFDGFKKILEEKRLWINETTFMNDRAEVREFGNLTSKCLAQMVYGTDMHPHPRRRGDLWKIDYFSSLMRRFCGRPAFVASFSGVPSLLSQWRAYCPRGGVSIGFPLQPLRDLATHSGWKSSWCEYEELDAASLSWTGPDVIRSPLSEMWSQLYTAMMSSEVSEADITGQRSSQTIEEALQYYGISRNDELEKRQATEKIRLSRLARACRLLAPIFKNRHFSEEREFRIFTEADSEDKIEIRIGAAGPVRFVPLCLDRFLINGPEAVRIMLGPCDPDYRNSLLDSLDRLLNKQRLKFQLTASDIPLRF